MKKVLIVLLSSFLAALALNVQAAGIDFDFLGPAYTEVPPPVVTPLAPWEIPPVIPPVVVCTGSPEFSDVQVMPENIWAPAGATVALEISGVVKAADGCGDVAAAYSMDNSSGSLTGTIDPDDDGNFVQVVVVNVARDGGDKYGNIYNGTLVATDSLDNESTLPFSITVLHDRGRKVGHSK